MASGEQRRAQLMAKARRGRSLSASEQQELTAGQLAKLRSEGHLRSTGQWVNPGDPTGGAWNPTPDQVQTLTDLYNNVLNPGSTVPNTGDDNKKNPAFTTGYTPDSIYSQAIDTLVANRARALASATEGERTLANDFGLGITQDDTGARFTGTWAGSDAAQGGIDPSNPFSRASLLNKSYFTAGRIGEGSYANRGLLTSGAYGRNQQRDAFRFEQGKDQLLKQFASSLQGYRDQRAQAQNNYNTGSNQANLDLFNRRRDEYDRMYPS